MKLNFDFDTKIEFDVHVDVEGFTPERKALTCFNPDNPAYSDSGSPADFDMFTCYFIFEYKGKKFKMEFQDELYNILEEELFDEIFEKGKIESEKIILDRFNNRTDDYIYKAI